ncbi:MAG: hypothetical protein PHI38_09520 [Sulfurimonas sp.]|uniref:hypothetical protein n=1 Tax=Sulfurimonas sp. TaxID=2022749 RepID=UPI00261F6226|nr:hypothetical protein [Sulfurimonas sp.]MDD3477093.1 hypothetical protein [Sulfurimonas sp.]
MSNKKWILYILISLALTLSAIASINYYIDSLWTFEHEHKFNQYQRGSKEREQKSNALYFRSKKYETIIFGSSRITYMNPYVLDDKTFNYAVSDMQPREYKAYLDFAITEAKQPITSVIIGLDFFGALEYEPFIAKESKVILEKITSPFYKYKLLFSLDTLKQSLSNIKNTSKKRNTTYKYSYVKRQNFNDINITKYNSNIQKDIQDYLRDRYKHKYDENYFSYISELIKSYPEIKFIFFTTPVSEEHFKVILSKDLYQDYERWLRESVQVASEINHFMYKSELAAKANIYFSDSNHAYPKTYKCLTNELFNKESDCPRTNIIINQTNLEEKLELLKSLNFQ